jgi:hypothetical protein
MSIDPAGIVPPLVLPSGAGAGTREQVELERLPAEESRAEAAQGAGEEPMAVPTGSGAAAVVDELFRRYRGTLAPAERERLRRLVAAARRPRRMALAGLVLAKAGLPVSEELAAPLYDVLERRSALAALPEEADAEDRAPSWWPPAQRILNTQGGGSVAHRVGSVAVELDAGVVEVEVALFEERAEPPPAAPGARHRKFVAVLETPRLGRVELRATSADRHLRVALATEARESTAALLADALSLSRALEADGWQVDELRHETRPAAAGAAVDAVVEHLITPGSVNRLA